MGQQNELNSLDLDWEKEAKADSREDNDEEEEKQVSDASIFGDAPDSTWVNQEESGQSDSGLNGDSGLAWALEISLARKTAFQRTLASKKKAAQKTISDEAGKLLVKISSRDGLNGDWANICTTLESVVASPSKAMNENELAEQESSEGDDSRELPGPFPYDEALRRKEKQIAALVRSIDKSLGNLLALSEKVGSDDDQAGPVSNHVSQTVQNVMGNCMATGQAAEKMLQAYLNQLM